MARLTSPNPLCVRLPNWVGDACMALPALRRLQQSGSPLVLLGRAWARELFAAFEAQDRVTLRGQWHADATLLRAWHQNFKAQHRGVAPQGLRGVCLPDSLSSALVFRWSGIRAVGYRDDGRSWLLDCAVPKPTAALHVVESYGFLASSALQYWGYPVANDELPSALNLPLTQSHHDSARQALTASGASNAPFVLISPTATGLHKGQIKTWAHYEALTRHLQAKGWPVYMCPPPNEIEAARQAAPSATLIPSLPLGAYAALTRLAALMICNDSGSSHVAAAAGARQLTLFGVTDPARTRPWSAGAECLGNLGHWPSLDEVEAAALRRLAAS